MKEQPVPPAWSGALIVLVFIVVGVAQCWRPTREQRPEDVCGGKNSRPVTIGSSMAIGCR